MADTEKPVSSLIVPVGPAVVTAGNIAASTTALIVSGGLAGPVAAGVVGLTGAAMLVHHRKQHKANGGKGRWFSRHGRPQTGTGNRVTGARPTGKNPGLFGRMAKKAGGALGRGLSHGTRSAGRGLANSSLGRKLHRAAGKTAHALGRATTSKVARALGGATKALGRGTGNILSGIGSGLSKGGIALGRTARWGKRKTGGKRSYIDDKRIPNNKKHEERRATIDDPNRNKTKTVEPRKPPKPPKPEKRRIPMANGNGYNTRKPGKSNGSPLLDAVNQFHAMATGFHHDGHLQTHAEALDFPYIVRQVADVIQSRLEEYKKSSISPDYTNALANLIAGFDQLAVATAQLGPLFEATHKELLANLNNSPEPEKWDSHNNI